MPENLNPVYDYIAGGVGGLSGLVIGHPLDTLKVKQQVPDRDHASRMTPSSPTQDFGLRSTLKLINEEGLARGHFRGLMSPLFSYAGLNAVYFGVYGNVLMRLRGGAEREAGSTNEIKDDYMNICLAGCAGGAVQTIPGCPFELAKVVLQSQVGVKSGYIYRGPWDACVDIIRKNGVGGVYRGFLLHNVRDIPSFGLYIVSYEYLSNSGQRMFPWLSENILNFISGGIAGILSWTSIMPFDVVKNRIQADCHGITYTNSWHCTRAAYQEGGLTIFFRGWPAVCFRAFLVNGFTLMIYSYLLDILQENS